MKTYSFSDLDGVLNHPSVGQTIINGEGTGSITFTQTNDISAMEVAADGNVMISKIKNNTGTVAVQIQQTSPLNQFLLGWYNYIVNAPASEFASARLVVNSRSTGEQFICVGVVPTKRADKPFQAQGQNITWNLMCSDLQTNLI